MNKQEKLIALITKYPGLDCIALKGKGFRPQVHGNLQEAKKDGLLTFVNGGWYVKDLTYWVLVVRDSKQDPWRIEFGSYLYSEVRQERVVYAQEELDNGIRKHINTYVFWCSDKQEEIDARVKALNS